VEKSTKRRESIENGRFGEGAGHMSEDRRERSGGTSAPDRQTQSPRTKAAKDTQKERLAEALRENLKRRKAQVSARRQEMAPK
jgi:hypothetical protein